MSMLSESAVWPHIRRRTTGAAGHCLRPSALRRITAQVATARAVWSGLTRFDLAQRYWLRLHHQSDLEVWPICWRPGQDTLLHDHGGSAGAFAVAQGTLTEDFGLTGEAALRTRRHLAGDAVGFGAAYLHNLVNSGPGLAVSVHAYSPPLTLMTYYGWRHGRLQVLRRERCDA